MGVTALGFAAQRGSLANCLLLIEAGAKISTPAAEPRQPIALAEAAGKADVAKHLKAALLSQIERGALDAASRSLDPKASARIPSL